MSSPETPSKPHLGGHCGITHTDSGSLKFIKELLTSKGITNPSMLDIGCSVGWQMDLARQLGFEVYGLEGDESIRTNPNTKCLSNIHFHDLTNSAFYFSRNQFDLIWCCEVAEHIEDKYVLNLIDSINLNLSNSGLVVFTFCDKEGTGIHHVNIKPEKYWLQLFELYGIIKDEELTKQLRARSTMVREFIRETGIILRFKELE